MQISHFRWFGTETHIFPDLKKHLHPHGRRWTVWTSEMLLIVNFVHPCPYRSIQKLQFGDLRSGRSNLAGDAMKCILSCP